MVRAELIKKLAEKEDIPVTQARVIVDIFFDEIAETICRGDRTELRGFGSFAPRKYNGYKGRNPKTGGVVAVKSKVLPFFKVGKELKARVDRR